MDSKNEGLLNKTVNTLLLIVLFSIAASASLVLCEMNGENMRGSLGPEWDGDGPANLAFFARYMLLYLVASLAFMIGALCCFLWNWHLIKEHHLMSKSVARIGVAFTILSPVITLLILRYA